MRDSDEDETYQCGCIPFNIMSVGRFLLIVEVACTILAVALAVAEHAWLEAIIMLVVYDTFLVVLAYGLVKRRSVFILIFTVFQVFNAILIGLAILAIWFMRDELKNQLPNISMPILAIPMIISFLIRCWEVHVGWRGYIYLKKFGTLA